MKILQLAKWYPPEPETHIHLPRLAHGLYYTFQRVLAELILALYLFENGEELRVRGKSLSAKGEGRSLTPDPQFEILL